MSNKDTRVLIKNEIRSTNYSGDRLRSVASLRDSTIRSQHPKTNTMCYLFKPPQSVTSASAKHTVRLYACKRPGSLRYANPLPPGGRPGPATLVSPLFLSFSLALPQAVARSRREQNRNLRNCDAHPSPVPIAKTAVTIRPSRGPGHPVVLRRLPLCLCPSRLIPTVSYKSDRWKFCSHAREATSPSHSSTQIKMRLARNAN